MQRLFGDGRAETGRVEAFSDGVLAIVITLLVLEIKVPVLPHGSEAALGATLMHLLPKILAWAVSFLFVFVFWVAHHYFYAALERVDRGLLWLNGLFLLSVSFTPFPTGLVGEYPGSEAAVALLAFAFFLSAASFALMRWYATFRAGLMQPADPAASRRAMRRSLTAPLLYGLAVVLAFIQPLAALLLIAGVPLIFIVAPAGAPRQAMGN